MRALCTFAASLLVVGASIGVAQAADPSRKIIVAYGQPQPSTNIALGSSLPIYLKFWEQEGVNVEIQMTPGASAALQLVIANKADVAVANAEAVMTAVQKGAAVKIVYSPTRGDIFGVALPAGELKDLKGKTVGVSSFASGGYPYLRGLLRQVGLKLDEDTNAVEIGVGARAAAAYQTKQVYALSLWDDQYAEFAERGIKFSQIIKDPRAAAGSVGSMVVRADDVGKRRDALIGFLRGIAKAQAFQKASAAATIRVHWAVYPESRPRDGITEASLASAVRVLRVREPYQDRNAMKTGNFGDIPRERFEQFQDYLVETGQIPGKRDVDGYFTNELIVEANKFDEAAIAALAKKYEQTPPN